MPRDGTSQEIERILRMRQGQSMLYHRHSAQCGHERVIHDDHIDYIVDGRLHHPHKSHCDDHGPITILAEYSKPHIIEIMQREAKQI